MECFACGKDLAEIVTERRSFSGGRPSESKVRVLNAWRSLTQKEVSLLDVPVERIDDIFQPYINKMCRTCFDTYGKFDELETRLRNNIKTVLRSMHAASEAVRKRSRDGLNPPITLGNSTPVTVIL